jgi:hypothetical protein
VSVLVEYLAVLLALKSGLKAIHLKPELVDFTLENIGVGVNQFEVLVKLRPQIYLIG